MTARDIRLAQAASMVELGEKWMRRPAHPSVSVKYNQASKLFEQAAEQFRAYGRWKSAGEAYSLAAVAEKNLNDVLIAATFYVDSAECLERTDITEAILAYSKAIAIYTNLSQFMSAALLQLRVAQLYEDDEALEDAAESNRLAADYFLGDENFPQAVRCMYNSGILYTKSEQYQDAFEKFDKAWRIALDDNLSKFNVPNIFFSASLCLLASGDLSALDDYIRECTGKDANIEVSKHVRYLLDVIDCARDSDIHSFVDRTWNFDYVHNFEPFQLVILNRVREMIINGPPDANEELSEEEEEEEEEEINDADSID